MELNELQKKHEVLYKGLCDLHNKHNDFTFWIRQWRGKEEGKPPYRFNRGDDSSGNNAYTNVGIVKFGSNCNHQWIGFAFNSDFTTCKLHFAPRNSDDDVKKFLEEYTKKSNKTVGIELVKSFFTILRGKINKLEPYTIYSLDDSGLINWIYQQYTFFTSVS